VLTPGFEPPTFGIASVNGQNGWTCTGPFDQGVVANTFGYAAFGLQSLRISDAVTQSTFGDQTFAAPLTNGVGESTASAGGFPVGTRRTHFEAQFDLASTVPGARQPGMHISISPDRGDGARMSYLRFEDGVAGFDVFFDDVQGTTDPANFVETQIATGLNRAVAHTIKLTFDAVEGPSNDVVKVFIDGILVQTGTSWENYSRFDTEAAADPHPAVIRTLLIRASGTATPGDAGKGFLLDNLSLTSQ
jgi:hypothetical protein